MNQKKGNKTPPIVDKYINPSKMNTKRSILESQDISQNVRSKTRTKKASFSNSILGSVSNDFTTYDQKKQCLKRMVKDSYTTKGNYICKTANKNNYDDYKKDESRIIKKSQIIGERSKVDNPMDQFPNFAGCAPMKRYQVVSVLGLGSFATAYLAVDKMTGEQVAIKCYYNIRKSYLDDAIKNEGEILSV